ncbi:MAG: ABC transporter substrate-binding protein [Methylophaga sp.]|nr:ABC transporter substrate-binding protein [Methylophaga sp.]
MTAVLTGPAATLGNDMRTGIESYFRLVNEQGGVQGRALEFIVHDDGYEPERAAQNMRKLIDDMKVLAILGNVGTPTAIVTVPIAQEKKTLLFGAFSGGGVLRSQPVNRYIINYRPSYAEETTEMINGLILSGIKPKEIAFFTQRDGYGDAAYQGAINALGEHGFKNVDLLVHGRYTRNTLNVEDAVAAFLDAPITPKAVIMAGGYAPSAKFIELLNQELPNIWFLNVSFVGSHSLQDALSNDIENVVVMQVVPNIKSSLPVVSEYLVALRAFDSSLEANAVSLEGFIIAKIFHQGLLQIKGDITKESIIDGVESLNGIDIGLGLDIYFNKLEHQAIHKLWLTKLNSGFFEDFSWQMMPDENIKEKKHE